MVESMPEWLTVEAEVQVPIATAQLVQLHVADPCDIVMMERDTYWLDMCLTPRPRNARLCYRDRWSDQRFERMGRVYFLPPGEDVQIRSDGGSDHASIFCHINPASTREWLGSDLDWKGRQFEASLDIANNTVRDLLLRLADELKQPGFASGVLIELISGQLVIELGRYFINCSDIPSAHALAPWRLQLIDEWLHTSPKTPSLSALANLCDLSVRQLTRGFRASRGCSIGEYISRARVEQAKQLLNGNQSIKTIAYSLGFATPSGFCAAFRRATGMTPGEFRAAE